ncbi:unnamed protein product [Discula destructiva]
MALFRLPATVFVQVIWMLAAFAAEHTIHPSLDQARLNAFPIFNSIQSAMRQWGSSLDHNGLSFIPAKIPKDGLLYHGTHSSDVKTKGLEWLAFEPEHSEAFAYSWRAQQKAGMLTHEQAVLQGPDDKVWNPSTDQSAIRGYLRTYQATRDLNLLYIDGMSAAKGCWGPMDAQDLVLRLINGTSPCDHHVVHIVAHDMERVGEICDMITPLGYNGLLRMEAGFEIVYCDFDHGGIRLLSHTRRPFWDELTPWYSVTRLVFHMVRAISQHYDGMAEADRVQLDFSRMVSAYFYPVNITNPDDAATTAAVESASARSLPRLVSTTHDERRSIQSRVFEVAAARDSPGIHWQSVTDAIVSRYADRLALLAQMTPAGSESDAQRFVAEILVATNLYVDFQGPLADPSDRDGEAAARTRCEDHYLQKVEPRKSAFTPEDNLIFSAIAQVTARICDTLFHVRSKFLDAQQSQSQDAKKILSRAAADGQKEIQRLVSDLQWTRWEKCGGCALGEICVVPMFPFGSKEDHRRGPHCVNESGMDSGADLEENYWHIDMGEAMGFLAQPL